MQKNVIKKKYERKHAARGQYERIFETCESFSHSSFETCFAIHTHHVIFLSGAHLILVLVLLGRRWRAARLQHLLEHLVADTTHGVVLCDGNVSQLIVMAQMGGVGVPVLVRQPLAVFVFGGSAEKE